MKSVFFLILYALLITGAKTGRSCKTELLRSFHLHSRITPNRINVLCPNIEYNCCTNHDQMRIHKKWSMREKRSLDMHYTKIEKYFMQYGAFVMQKQQFDLKNLINEFSKATPKPGYDEIEHLKKLEKLISQKKIDFYKVMLHAIQRQQKKYNKYIKRLRSSFFCSLCDWHNQNYINVEAQQVNYHGKFCKKFSKRWAPFWMDKYKEIMALALYFDEFFYILSHRRLIRFQADRGIIHKYKINSETCAKGDKKSCNILCSEFNLNKYSYLTDGEEFFFKDFLKQWARYGKYLSGDKALTKELFTLRKKFYKFSLFTKEVKPYSVMGKKHINMPPLMPWDPNYRDPNRKSISFGNTSFSSKRVIEKVHPTNTVQLESLDDQIDSSILFRIKERPVDISRYDIQVQRTWGINPLKDQKGMNLNVSVEQVLGLIHHGGKNANSLNEIIENDVKKLIKDLKIDDIEGYVDDHSIMFKKVAMPKPTEQVSKKKKVESQPQRRMLNSSDSYLKTILSVLFFVLIQFKF